MKYIHPKSLTWWAGVVSVLLGLVMISSDASEWRELARVISILTGSQDASPASIIVVGLGLIGIRDKLERMGK
jgi:hypothetical protein